MGSKSKPQPLPLPKPGERNILITSALPYVNNVPHLGNIIGSVLSADVFARYCRSRGCNTLFVGGTDEFGTTTALRAREEGTTPNDICDKYHAVHSEVYKWFNISFDIFGRTTNEQHAKITHDIFRELWEGGMVKEKVVEQLWCEKCEGFVFDRLVEGGCPGCGYPKARGDQCGSCDCVFDAVQLVEPRCKIDGEAPVRRESNHLFLDMERLGPDLERWVRGKGENWSENARKIMKGTIERGLENFMGCITRDGLDWGTPVPEWLKGFEGKVFYPWWDALLGYISITASGMEEGKWEKWWRPSKIISKDNASDTETDDGSLTKKENDNGTEKYTNPGSLPQSSNRSESSSQLPNIFKNSAQEVDVQLYQFLGADNIPFHAILFPATLLPLDPPYTTLHHISSTNYLTYQGGRFSKSLGTGVFGDNAQETGLSADIFRFYLLYSRPEVGMEDTEFTWNGLITANNDVLLDKLGLFIHQVLRMAGETRFGSVIPDWSNLPYPPYVESFVADADRLLGDYRAQLERAQLRAGLVTALNLTIRANRFLLDHRLLGTRKPEFNTLAGHFEGEEGEDEVKVVVGLGVNVVYLLAALLEPFIPDTAAGIYRLLRVEQPMMALDRSWLVNGQEDVKPGHQVGKCDEIREVISGIKEEKAKEWKRKFGGKKKRQRHEVGAEGVNKKQRV